MLHICTYAFISFFIHVYIFVCAITAYAEVSRKPEIAYSVYDAEVDGLGGGALFARNFFGGYGENFGGRAPVYILVVTESAYHDIIVGYMCEQTKLYL